MIAFRVEMGNFGLLIVSESDFVLSGNFLRSGRYQSVLSIIIDLNLRNIRTKLRRCLSIVWSQMLRMTSLLDIASRRLLIQLVIRSVEHVIALNTPFISLTLIQTFWRNSSFIFS